MVQIYNCIDEENQILAFEVRNEHACLIYTERVEKKACVESCAIYCIFRFDFIRQLQYTELFETK